VTTASISGMSPEETKVHPANIYWERRGLRGVLRGQIEDSFDGERFHIRGG
jgi:hypothetical protein